MKLVEHSVPQTICVLDTDTDGNFVKEQEISISKAPAEISEGFMCLPGTLHLQEHETILPVQHL